MNAHHAVQSLTLTRNEHNPQCLDYAAEISFTVSFGKMSFTISGSLETETNPPQSVIYDIVSDAALQELKKVPYHFELVSRHMAWEAAGKPPYAAWYLANHPLILN